MATLAPETISVTLPGEVSAFFHRRAREANTTVDHEIAAVAWAFMEDEEDEISDEEDAYLSRIADQNEDETDRYYSSEEAWGRK